ncbi:RhoGAP-domain-containing protein [Patellaria atrata CBS 101060]|uniref:RhoGAP-domain-containing protein n=1 Tax=Patellaria atrata CBS 101060 TaxID=1346257 RepID=A0A9P4VT69_9PEZI|nr:RhoGAP-domain-containing protein [Patellaria atrata CBS 101060]
MLQGRDEPGSSPPTVGDDEAHKTTSTTSRSQSSLTDSVRVLRENPSGRPNILPSRSDPRGGRRKPAPSPLQQSTQPLSPTSGQPNPLSPRAAYYQPGDLEQPRSPRERLDALLAIEEADNSAPLAVHNTTSRDISGRTLTNPSSYAQLRTVSAPLTTSNRTSPPPSSPTNMMPPMKPNRPDPRPTVARNASIDSTVSSVSSSSYKPNSHPDGASSSADLASYVATHGSPDSALQSLWKEKQSASVHNAQLWRLVEKQRTMILGLNKDLERAYKDKDRYRKKLKEHLAQVPPLPEAAARLGAADRDNSQSPAPSDDTSNRSNSAQETVSEASKQAHPQESPHTFPLAQSHPRAQPSIQTLAPSPNVSEDSTSNEPSPNISNAGNISALNSAVPAALNVRKQSSSPPAESIQRQVAHDNHGPKAITLQAAPKSHKKAPSLSLTQATPTLGSSGFPSPGKPTHPLRKAPPAPLDLSQPNRASSHLHQSQKPAEEGDDSEYDDILEVDELPQFERGRRKTREEDDRLREAIMQKEQETRSRSKSKKKGKSKSKSKPPAESQPEPEPEIPVPQEEKAKTIAIAPPAAGFMAGLPSSPRIADHSGSLNAMLSPANSEGSMITQRSIISTPLMSPGLPMSPRPGDRPLGSPLPRGPKSNLTSPPMSPGFAGGLPLSPRAPKQPIPLPPITPNSFGSPHNARIEQFHRQEAEKAATAGGLAPPSIEVERPGSSFGEPSSPESIYQGLVSDQYPGLLLPPNALPSISVKVFSSRLRPSRLSFIAPKATEEDPVFILAIFARSDGKQLWRVEKTTASLPILDSQLKSLCKFTGKLPDKNLFAGHAPAKIDARRAALNTYFDNMLDTPMSEKAGLVVCEYFSTDVTGTKTSDSTSVSPSETTSSTLVNGGRPHKEGYLTKRGKNFGGWKARYFVLEGPELRYYEAPGGAHLGTIKLFSAQIGKQSQQQANQSPSRQDDPENQYRHAFLILEPKKRDSSSLVRHVLCAESDEERDTWVDILLQYVDYQEEQPGSAKSMGFTKGAQDGRSRNSPDVEKPNTLQTVSYNDVVAAEAPVKGPTSPTQHSHQTSGSHPTISGPTNATVIENSQNWGMKNLMAPPMKADKKRSIFAGFRGRSSSDIANAQQQQQQQQQQNMHERPNQARVVFGLPLAEAVECSAPLGIDTCLPAVVYRCLEYLNAKNAASEEGIFRLSGSNIVIKALRERFNTEGDVKLLDGQYYDVHAVASLLKLYLRELPVSILTRELHLDFLKVLDLDEKDKKISAFNVLVHRLPRVNIELIQALSCFLLDIVNNSDVNKMTVRNVGIVFAPTLNIPAPLISFFLTDYSTIFGAEIDEASSPIREITVTAPLTPESIRSPRRQMFSDLPTPAYNQTSFNPPSILQQLQSSHPHHYQQQQGHSHHEAGFIPMQPSYEQPMYQAPQPMGGMMDGGFSSLNGALGGGGGDNRTAKQRRRESGMLLVNMGLAGQRKSSVQKMRDNQQGMVQEESAFE